GGGNFYPIPAVKYRIWGCSTGNLEADRSRCAVAIGIIQYRMGHGNAIVWDGDRTNGTWAIVLINDRKEHLTSCQISQCIYIVKFFIVVGPFYLVISFDRVFQKSHTIGIGSTIVGKYCNAGVVYFANMDIF